MWFSFWVTVAFGVLFVLVEVALNRPLPLGVGVIPAAAVSIATNGWEDFWHWQFHYHDKLCARSPSSGELQCWDSSSQRIPDAAQPPDPPGWVEVILPWYGERTLWEWIVTSVPIDLAAAGVAAGLVWLTFRSFGRHDIVEQHITPFK